MQELQTEYDKLSLAREKAVWGAKLMEKDLKAMEEENRSLKQVWRLKLLSSLFLVPLFLMYSRCEERVQFPQVAAVLIGNTALAFSSINTRLPGSGHGNEDEETSSKWDRWAAGESQEQQHSEVNIHAINTKLI